MILALRYIDRENPELMAWANKAVEENKDCKVIVTTHGYLNSDGSRLSETVNKNTGGAGYGEYLWNELVKKHENIFMVLSGHIINDFDEGSVASLVSEGDCGNKVYQYMINSQDADTYYNGLGMIMLMHFSGDGRKISFRYYSPVHNAYYKAANQFEIILDDLYAQNADGSPVTALTDGVKTIKTGTAGHKLIAASYDGNGCLLDVRVSDSDEVIIDITQNAAVLKGFLWNEQGLEPAGRNVTYTR